MNRSMGKPFLNIHEVDTFEAGHGEVFHAKHGLLSRPLGATKIGASVTRVQPGKAAFQFHHHFGNEEQFFIVSGEGTLRVGDELFAVKARDYIVHPPGGPETAHQLVNTGTEELVYLSLAAMGVSPEVCGYPDSDKLGVFPGGNRRIMIANADSERTAYFDGDDGSKVKEILAKLR